MNNLNNILLDAGLYGGKVLDICFRKTKISITGEINLNKKYKTIFTVDISTDDYNIINVVTENLRR